MYSCTVKLISLLILYAADRVFSDECKCIFEVSGDSLLQRLAVLEARDKEREETLTELKERWDQDREKLEQEITQLRIELARHNTRQRPTERSARYDRLSLREIESRRADVSKSRVTRMENEQRVAFFASVTPHDVYNVSANQVVKFDSAVVNIGHAYHPSYGLFIAPVSGTYSFSATIYGRNPSGYMYFALEKNDKVYASYEIKVNQQVSQTVILSLQQGDEVCVKSRSNDHDLIGQTFTTFSGFLIYEDYEPPAVIAG